LLVGVCLAGLGCGRQERPDEVWQRVDEAALPEALERPRPGSRPVTMEPAGTWHVTQSPERFITFQSIEADMALTLGVQSGHLAMAYPGRFATLDRLFFRQVPGLSVRLRGVVELTGGGSVGREVFYELDPDVFLVDPRLPLVYWGWDVQDLERAASEAAPFFGNFIRKERGSNWGPPYRQYTPDEVLAKYAELFGRQARYRRFAKFRDDLLERIERGLPPEADRPEVMLLNAASQPDKGRFTLVNLQPGQPEQFAGTWIQHYRQLGLKQAYDFSRYASGEWTQVDYEMLAAIDPPVMIVVWSLALFPDAESFEAGFVQPMRDHPVGRTLQAVRNGRVLPGGTAEQGPLTYLFQLEMMAKLVFPERFGRWRWGTVPDEPLFDRAELGEILTMPPPVEDPDTPTDAIDEPSTDPPSRETP
jgi:iron complex transport system substrate-binding protein